MDQWKNLVWKWWAQFASSVVVGVGICTWNEKAGLVVLALAATSLLFPSVRRELFNTPAKKLMLGVVLLPVAAACDGSGVAPVQVSTPEEFEAHLIDGGATPVVARLIRHAIELEDGEVLRFGPAGSLATDTDRVLRRYSLPDGREAVVVLEGTDEPQGTTPFPG